MASQSSCAPCLEPKDDTDLLRAPAVDDLLRVLRLLAVLPCQVNNERAVVLVHAHVDRLDLVLPAAARRLPLDELGARGRRRVERVAVLLLLVALRAVGGRGRVRLAPALAGRERRFGVLEELLLAADARVVRV